MPAFPPFSDKIDWVALNSDCVDAARRLEQNFQVADAQTKTAFTKSSASGFRFAFAETLRLGNDAYKAAAGLRTSYDLKPLSFDPPRWDWVTFLEGELEKLDTDEVRLRKKREKWLPQHEGDRVAA